MTRQMLPRNRALQDRVLAVLAEAHPEAFTSAQIADRVGGVKTYWETCKAVDQWFVDYYRDRGWDGPYCRAEHGDGRFPAKHHPPEAPGMAAQDSWEVPWRSGDINPILNRLGGEGRVTRHSVPDEQALRWVWVPDQEALAVVADLEAALRLDAEKDA